MSDLTHGFNLFSGEVRSVERRYQTNCAKQGLTVNDRNQHHTGASRGCGPRHRILFRVADADHRALFKLQRQTLMPLEMRAHPCRELQRFGVGIQKAEENLGVRQVRANQPDELNLEGLRIFDLIESCDTGFILSPDW